MVRLRACGVCTLLLLAAGCGSAGGDSPAETPQSESDAIIDGTPATSYPEAAYLDIDFTNQGGYLCSAALIAPKVVLTAGHCVDGHSHWEVHVGTQTRVSTSAVTKDWAEYGAETVNPNHHDIGLVFLDQAVVLAKYPTLASAPVAAGTHILNVGRVANGVMTNAAYVADSVVSDGATIGYPFDYLSTDVIQPGDSGGPDFAVGTHRIVAVNSGAGNGIEVLARVDLVRAWLDTQIAAHGGTGVVAPQPTCTGTAEHESNDTWPTAAVITAGTVCGALASTSDADWFSVTYGPGTLSLELAATGDAVFAVGQAGATTCTPSLTDLRTLGLTATKAERLCVRVTSPAKHAQAYSLKRK